MQIVVRSKVADRPVFVGIARNHPHAGFAGPVEQVLQGEGVDVGRLVPMVGQPFGDWHASARHQVDQNAPVGEVGKRNHAPAAHAQHLGQHFARVGEGLQRFLQHHHVECLIRKTAQSLAS